MAVEKIINDTLCKPTIYALPVGIGIFDADLIVQWINHDLSSLYGYRPEEVVGRKWLSLIPATEERKDIYSRVLSGESLNYPEARSPLGEVERCFDVRYRPVYGEDGTVGGMLATCIEITDRKIVERQLIESEKKLRKLGEELDRIFQFSPDMLCIVGTDGYFKRINPAFAQTLGHTQETLLSTSYVDFVHPDDHDNAIEQVKKMVSGEPTLRLEMRFRCRDDSYKWLAWRSVTDIKEDSIYAVARDITDVKEAQQAAEKERNRAEKLRNMYLKQMLSAQEEERRRIARELHDDTGSSLTSLVVGLRALSETPISGDAKSQVQRLKEIAENTVSCVSRLAHGLHPSAIEDLGLKAALERYTTEYALVNQIEVDLYVKADAAVDQLPLNIATALYRIVQEALANVAKHAKANNVSVIVDGTDELLRIIIEDDGLGFSEASLEDLDSSSGLGIQGIRERLTLLAGSLTIESIFGGGTTLFVAIPRPDAAIKGEAAPFEQPTA